MPACQSMFHGASTLMVKLHGENDVKKKGDKRSQTRVSRLPDIRAAANGEREGADLEAKRRVCRCRDGGWCGHRSAGGLGHGGGRGIGLTAVVVKVVSSHVRLPAIPWGSHRTRNPIDSTIGHCGLGG